MLKKITLSALLISASSAAYSDDVKSFDGFYGGLGYEQTLSGNIKRNLDGSSPTISTDLTSDGINVHFGYNYNIENFVVGGELSRVKSNFGITEGTTTTNYDFHENRLSLRVGYLIGKTMPYAKVSAGKSTLNSLTNTGKADTRSFAIGAERFVGKSLSVFGEVSKNEAKIERFNNANASAKLEDTRLNVGVNFHF